MSKSYQNPILRGMYPDPSIVRVEDTYYLANSTFEYYPGIALAKSTDLLNWTKLPSIAAGAQQTDLRSAKSNEGIFAVCIRYFEGYFYVITTNFAEFKNFFIRGKLTNDTIEWENQRTEVDIMGIDPDIYFEDGHMYIQFTGYIDDQGTKAIQQVEIDPATGQILRGPELLTYGTGGRDVEGPRIIKKDGWYYLLIAEGGTGVGHMITMMRSRSLWGPYAEEDGINPLFTNRDRAEQPLQNIGHADLFQDVYGHWWLTCLGTRPASVGFTQITNIGRETLLYPVGWDGDWPQIYTGIPEVRVDLSAFPQHADTLANEQELNDFVDTFSTEQLHPEWLMLRDQPELTVGVGNLHLSGSTALLSDLACPAFVGVRQTEHHEQFQVELDLEQTDVKSGKFGVACLINADHYAALLIDQQGTGYQVLRQQKVADLELTEVIGHLAQLPERFTITHTTSEKTFAAEAANQKISFTTAALHFSNEAIAALNTGDIQGIYALGDAELVIKKAARTAIFDS